MKKNDLLFNILLIVFCLGFIGTDVLYFKRNIPLFSAGIAVAAAMAIANVILLVLRIKKQNQDERYYKILTFIGMICTVVAASIPVFGILIPMFASL